MEKKKFFKKSYCHLPIFTVSGLLAFHYNLACNISLLNQQGTSINVTKAEMQIEVILQYTKL